MSKIKTAQTTSNLQSWEELRRFISIQVDDIIGVVNGNLSFTDNFRAKFLTVNFPGAGVNVEVQHGLGFIPNGYLALGADAPASVYDGSGASNGSVIFLKASGAANVRLMIF